MGVPAPTIAEAVFARFISAVNDERGAANKVLKGPEKSFQGDKADFIDAIHDALYCAKICSYAQGFQLMREAQKEYSWTLNFGEIAQIWRGGCIIRAAFLQKITEAYARDPILANLLLDPYLMRHYNVRNTTGGELSARPRSMVFRSPLFLLPSPIMIVIVRFGSPKTSCKRSAISSVRTPMNALTSPGGKSSTLTGSRLRDRKLKYNNANSLDVW